MSQTPLNQNESIVLIIDTSSSAASWWDETRRAAETIRNLAGSDKLQLFALGNPTPAAPNILNQVSLPRYGQQAQGCSLIAPVMEELIRQGDKFSVIIVGNGEVFDLDDWTDDPHVGGWLLVRTGSQSLQGTSGRHPEIMPDQIRNLRTLLSYFSPFPGAPYERSGRETDHATYEWQVDAAGYPLIKVEPLNSFVHLLPVTKPQFEKFIASGRQQGFDDQWYSARLMMSPRASYRSQDLPTLEQLFMTGISTDEAGAFSKWLGREYRLLSAEDWAACYEWFGRQTEIAMPQDLSDRLSRDAQAIWEISEAQCQDRCRHPTLQDLSLLTQGILEWVVERPGRYCGLGEPASSKFQRKAFDPVQPLGPEPRRLTNLGFRLRTR